MVHDPNAGHWVFCAMRQFLKYFLIYIYIYYSLYYIIYKYSLILQKYNYVLDHGIFLNYELSLKGHEYEKCLDGPTGLEYTCIVLTYIYVYIYTCV